MYANRNEINRMFGAMDLLRSKMNRIFNEFNYPLGSSMAMASEFPRTNAIEHEDRFELQAELPGLSKQDLAIKVQGNYLEISGKRSVSAPEGYKTQRNERGARHFSRSFTLPENVDADKVDALLKDGILHLTLPKLETAKPRQITIH